jgi:hypothetical protein
MFLRHAAAGASIGGKMNDACSNIEAAEWRGVEAGNTFCTFHRHSLCNAITNNQLLVI